MKIKLPYLDRYRSRGKVFYYVRRKGRPNVRLKGVPGTAEFMAAYNAALASAPARVCRHGDGTFGKLVRDFYASVEFANLKPSSQRTYRHVLESAVEKHGHRPAATLPAEYASKMVEEIGRDRPGLANLTRSVMHRLMKFAIRTRVRSDNPFSGLPAYKQGTHHTWSDAELKAFEDRWPLGTRARLAYALLLYTGQRGGDVVRMRRQDISDGVISVVQQKSRKGSENAALSIPIHAKLHAAIKAVLRRLAERGGSAKEISAVSGHKSLKEIERYTAAADQRRLSVAAMGKLSDEE